MLAAVGALTIISVMGLLLAVVYDRFSYNRGGSGDLSDPFKISPGGCLLVMVYLCGLTLAIIAYQGFHGG